MESGEDEEFLKSYVEVCYFVLQLPGPFSDPTCSQSTVAESNCLGNHAKLTLEQFSRYGLLN